MRIGLAGLGRMGGNMAARLARAGHEVVAFDLSPTAVQAAARDGATGAASLAELAASLPAPRVVWLMLPAGQATEDAVEALSALLSPGDLLVDGGNADYRDTLRRGAHLARRGVRLVDAGVSGGVLGLEEGYCLMLGGGEEDISFLAPLLDALAAPGGWARVGPPGAGHFAKMTHNGIEYALLQAYAEGFSLLEAKEEFAYDLAAVAELWRHGSVVRSRLLDLVAGIYDQNPALEGVAPEVDDSGSGRWTVREGVELGTPLPAIAASLFARFDSRGNADHARKLLALLRNRFGGHPLRPQE